MGSKVILWQKVAAFMSFRRNSRRRGEGLVVPSSDRHRNPSRLLLDSTIIIIISSPSVNNKGNNKANDDESNRRKHSCSNISTRKSNIVQGLGGAEVVIGVGTTANIVDLESCVINFV